MSLTSGLESLSSRGLIYLPNNKISALTMMRYFIPLPYGYFPHLSDRFMHFAHVGM